MNPPPQGSGQAEKMEYSVPECATCKFTGHQPDLRRIIPSPHPSPQHPSAFSSARTCVTLPIRANYAIEFNAKWSLCLNKPRKTDAFMFAISRLVLCRERLEFSPWTFETENQRQRLQSWNSRAETYTQRVQIFSLLLTTLIQ